MPKLINELRCSLGNPRKFSSLPRNQHRPRHIVSPFTDDQQKSPPVLQIPFHQGIHCPSTQREPLPNHLEHPISCAANSHHVPSHSTCTLTGSMCLHVLSAFACNRLSWITNVAHWRTPRWHSQCSSCGGLAVSARLKLFFHAHSSCHQKNGLLLSNVTCFLCSLPSAT